MSRMPPLDTDTLSPEQKRVYDQIAGKRKPCAGRFRCGCATRSSPSTPTSSALRSAITAPSAGGFSNSASSRCAGLDPSQYAWSSHAPQAELQGIAPEIITAIRDNRTPDFKKDDERVAYEVAREIMDTNALSQAGYDKAIKQFGEQGTVELISTIGYYAMVGIFLKSFDVRPPDGSTPLK